MGHGPTIVTDATAVLVTDGVPGGTEEQRSLEKRYLPQAHVPRHPPGPQGQLWGKKAALEEGMVPILTCTMTVKNTTTMVVATK